MENNLTPKQYAEYLIKRVKAQGCCYDLLPILNKNKIVIKYVVDGDRIGFYESEKSYGKGLPEKFLKATFKEIKLQLASGAQESAFAKPYWDNKKKKEKVQFNLGDF